MNFMSKLNLSDWSDIAEIAATAVVIVTLVFVGLEVRQNTKAVESSAAQAVHENFASWYSSVQSDPTLFDISIRAMQDYSSVSEVEKGQFIAMFMAFSAHTQNAFYKWKEGSLSPELWRGWEQVSLNFYGTPGGKAFWAERGYMFGEEYRNYVETKILTSKANTKAKPWGAFEIEN